MIIDVHTHIFPEDICEHREDYFEGEGPFQLLYDSPKSRLKTAEELIRAMEENHVDKSVIFGFPWKNEEYYRKNNDYVIASVKKFPDRLIGFCCADVYNPGAATEVLRCLDAGLAGVGELAFYQSGIEKEALELLEPVMALCREKKVPVMIHTNEPVGHHYPVKTPNTLAQIYELAKIFPDNKIILAHWGGGIFFYTLLKKEAKEVLKNIYYDTAASPFLYAPEIYPIAKAIMGIDKILMGTDYPLLNPARYYKEMEMAGLSDHEKERICGGNAAQLLGIG